jgi:predicted benzoate:H+ symporter BenE
MTVAGLAPAGVLFGFGAFLISTGLFYGLPLPVQPMKAVSAVILTDGLRPGEVAAAGMMLGIILLVLGTTGWIGRLAHAIPQSISAGLQLGLGLLMGVLGVKLMLQTPWIGFGALAALVLLTRIPRCPAALIVLAASAVAGWATSGGTTPTEIAFAPSFPHLVIPTWTEVWRSLEIAVIPQLSLTLTNAVIVTSKFFILPGKRRNAPLARCRCVTALAACRPNIASVPEPGWPRSSSASWCWFSRSGSPITLRRCSRSFRLVRSGRY